MSKYGWTLWAVIRHNEEPDPELIDWGPALYAQAVTEFDSDEFEQLLEQVGALRTLRR